MKRYYFLYMLLAIIVYGCERSGQPQANKKSFLVSTIKVEAKDAPLSVEYVAQIQSSHLVNIQSRVTGFLEKRVYREGAMVKAGDILFEMDKKPFIAQANAAQAAVSRQEAALATASSNLARVRPLAAHNALSQKDLDDAVGTYEANAASLEMARAQLETALLNLSYCTITSPLDGITSAALHQEGSYLNVTDSQLTTVAALNPIWVNFSISEYQIQHYYDQIAKGQIIPPKNDEYVIEIIQVNGQLFPYTGRITFRDPFFNPQTGTFLIRASVENHNGDLRPNQYVRVRVQGSIRPKAILVPQRAVQESSKGHFVWVIDQDKKAAVRPIEVGEWQGKNWLVTSGLVSGDEIITDGTTVLYPGADVEVKPSAQGS